MIFQDDEREGKFFMESESPRCGPWHIAIPTTTINKISAKFIYPRRRNPSSDRSRPVFRHRRPLTTASRPQTLWGLTKWLAHVGAICVPRSAPTFLQSPDPFCSPQRVENVGAISQSRGLEK